MSSGVPSLDSAYPLQALRYWQVATTVLVLYDHGMDISELVYVTLTFMSLAINLDREINLVWFYKQQPQTHVPSGKPSSTDIHVTRCSRSLKPSFRAKFDFISTLYLLTRYLGEAVLMFSRVLMRGSSTDFSEVYVDTSFSPKTCLASEHSGLAHFRLSVGSTRNHASASLCDVVSIQKGASIYGSMFFHGVGDEYRDSLPSDPRLRIDIAAIGTARPPKTWATKFFIHWGACAWVVFSFVTTFIVPKQNFYVPAVFLLSSLVVLATRLVLAIREPRTVPAAESPSDDVWADHQRLLKSPASSPMTERFTVTIEELESV
ncbi:hypothetical protein BU15DRAFT_57927 [Melanogaster broomeanus]|nr:hypothetical protein BU15DRAFT_57927 [Melanogaster broomeanus]